MANSDDVVVDLLMRRRGDEEAHHKALLNTLAPLYDGLTPQQSAELTAYLSQFHPVGNNLGNLINLPKELHQAGIHKFAREQGYEHHPNLTSPVGFVRDIQDAAELPAATSLPYRQHVGEQYLKQAVPAMNDYINDALTASPAMQERLDFSPVRQAVAAERNYVAKDKRFAGAAMEAYYNQTRSGSPGTNENITVSAQPGSVVFVG